jgi:uncharacterized short protein YbdD (DUF466 family)
MGCEEFFCRKVGFEDYKNYVDQELGRVPDTERRFFQRLRDMPKVKEYKTRTERGFMGIGLKSKEQSQEVQTKIDAVAEVADVASSLDPKKIKLKADDDFVECKISAKAATALLEQKNSADNSGKLVLRVLPSQGEPCEGANSAGCDCGFGSEHYLISPEGNKSVWCKAHLNKILLAYDPASYEIHYGLEDDV